MRTKPITKETAALFEAYLYSTEKSRNTVIKYSHDVAVFLERLGDTCASKEFTVGYKRELCERFAPSSVNSMLSSLNSFFEFAGRRDLKVKTLRIQRRIFADKSRELTKADYEKLLESAKSRGDSRMYCLMQTMGATGLRVSELRCVTAEAVKAGHATINCKGKIRCVFLPPQLCELLGEYTAERRIKSGPVFISRKGVPLDRSNVWKMLKRECEKADVPSGKVFPHNFRHLFARTYYSDRKDIVRLADLLGHSNINTTRIYTAESGDSLCVQLQHLGLLLC